MDKPLSNYDVQNLLDNDVKVITYDELDRYKTIENLLYPYNKVVILYLATPDYGHWCCIFRYPDNKTIVFIELKVRLED